MSKMIHHVYRKVDEAGVPVQRDVEALWQQLQQALRGRNVATAAMLDVEAALELDEPRQVATLVVHPGLYETIVQQPARVIAIGEAIAEVFGPAYAWALVPGTWHRGAAVAEPRSPFERLKQVAPNGAEFWTQPDLAAVLGHVDKREFSRVIARAQMACANSGHRVEDHFAIPAQPIGMLGPTAERLGVGCLSRYACYLIIQNSDPRLPAVALGQTYFAVQTRRQEERDRQLEDQRRLMLRREMAHHNKKLAAAARRAGVVAPEDFSAFTNEGYRGLYGGLTARAVRQRRALPENTNLLDTMGSAELAANLFRATQTEEKMRRDGVEHKEQACRIHHLVGAKVRETMRELGGAMPEDLPVAEHIRTVRRRLQAPRERGALKAL
jgi:DNA-damage-inducible protein D